MSEPASKLEWAALVSLGDYPVKRKEWDDSQKEAHNAIAAAIQMETVKRNERAAQPIPYEARQGHASETAEKVEQRSLEVLRLALALARAEGPVNRTRALNDLARASESYARAHKASEEATQAANHPQGTTYTAVIAGQEYEFELALHWTDGVRFVQGARVEALHDLLNWSLGKQPGPASLNPVWARERRTNGTLGWRLQEGIKRYPLLPEALEAIRVNLRAVKHEKAA
jgi:hypothetical protein